LHDVNFEKLFILRLDLFQAFILCPQKPP